MAHDAMLTWILVALRAATEPVKEEAMQAMIVVMSFGVCVLQSCVCWNGEGDAARLPLLTLMRIRPTESPFSASQSAAIDSVQREPICKANEKLPNWISSKKTNLR